MGSMMNGDKDTTLDFINRLAVSSGSVLAIIGNYFVVRYGESNMYHIYSHAAQSFNAIKNYETGDFLKQREPTCLHEEDVWTTYDHPSEEEIKLYAHGHLRLWLNDNGIGEEK